MAPVAIVTGASSGIGAATARLLRQRGFDVYGTSRRPTTVPPDAGASIHWLEMDVRDEASVKRGVQSALDAGGRLDALVCNAGYGIFGSVEETSLDAANEQFDTNFFGTLRTLRAALPAMRAQRGGRIVVVGSLAGRAPIPFQAHYSASKAATTALAFALRSEVHPFGIRVSLVEPGDIRTAFNDATDFGDTSASVYGDRIARCRRVVEVSLLRAPGPERVAATIHRALTARRPRVRYAVGPNAWSLPVARRLLPDALLLRLIRRHFKV
jgi:NAD(P)-dependent dehydrogenase (short-subunit alcohol dehydrogenase family)